MAFYRKHPLEDLEDFRLSGDRWRVVSVSNERAVVDLCTYSGEPLKRLESDDPAEIAHLRRKLPIRFEPDDKGTHMTSVTPSPPAELAFPLVRANERPAKPRVRGVTEIRGPYYSMMGARYLKEQALL